MVYSLPHRAISSAGERCLHTAEVAGSKPASPTKKYLEMVEKYKPPIFRSGGCLLQPYCNASRGLFQCFLQSFRGLFLYVGQGVGIDVQGYAYGGVAEYLGDDFGVDVFGEQ